MTFDEWCVELDRIAKEDFHFCDMSITTTTGKESWKGYFEDEYTPLEAFNEMMSYGDGSYD